MMLNPPPSPRELDQIYGAEYALLNGDEESRARFARMKQTTARYYLDLIGRYRGGAHGGAFLEIGSGYGDLLVVASGLGYEVTGVEYSGHSCAIARNRLNGSGTIIQGEVSDVRHLAGTFDICVLSDVIEHVYDPRAFLTDILGLLKRGGVLFIATPSLDSWSAKLLKDKWMEFKPEHIHYFNQNTLHSLLFQTGYERVIGLPGVKFLTPEYIVDHFDRYPVPNVSLAVQFAQWLMPASLRRKQLRVVASGMIAIATAGVVPARRKVSIVLPAYNEAATLEKVLRMLLDKDLDPLEKEIILVESNSTDGTREIALKFQDHPQVRLVLEDRPQGKGHAVRTGFAHATGDFIIIQDADLEYDLEDYEILLEPLLKGYQAFVLGSRHGGKTWKMRSFRGQWGLSKFLNVGHWLFKTLVNVFYGLKLKDPFTMYKMFRRDCLTGLTFECNYFDFDYEVLIKLVRKGYRPVEIPVNYRSRSFAEGKKVSLLRDPWTWVRAVVKFRLTRIDTLANVCKQVPHPRHPPKRKYQSPGG
jgi:glycosyltransferase involved in cell wall biosynthesis/SAM-dependent methyltransferase